MEVAVITRHAIANYGSLLQAAATQNAIEALGHSCRIIDYVRPNEVCTQLHKCQLQQKPRWNRTPPRRRVYSTLRYTENVMAGPLFESARRQMLHLTEPFSTAQELTANGPKADVYMTGSDQVWGPMEDGTYDPVYRLAFGAAGHKTGGHNGHAPVAFVFNGAAGHNARHAAAGTDQHRDKTFAGKAELAEDTVHDECEHAPCSRSPRG